MAEGCRARTYLFLVAGDLQGILPALDLSWAKRSSEMLLAAPNTYVRCILCPMHCSCVLNMLPESCISDSLSSPLRHQGCVVGWLKSIFTSLRIFSRHQCANCILYT